MGNSWTPFSDYNSGTDYMLYFNLFTILNWNTEYTEYGNYQYIRPQDVCPMFLIKEHYTESDKKNFLASNFIQAGNIAPNYSLDDYDWYTYQSQGDYIIKNDNDPDFYNYGDVNYEYNLSRPQVTFIAGHYIDLLPGFYTQIDPVRGGFFDASIDQTLTALDCSENPNMDCIDVWESNNRTNAQ